MHLNSKETALKVAAGQSGGGAAGGGSNLALARTPPLAPPSLEEDQALALQEKAKKGESTRLDGRPVRRGGSILEKARGWLGPFWCWGRRSAR